MIRIHVLLLVAGATLVISTPHNPPPYVESREYFEHAKYYVQSNLPLKTPDIATESGRRNSAFGILTGVLIDLVKAADNSSQYEPFHVLSKSIPASWRNYMKIAIHAQNVLSDVDIKIKAITDYIDNACGTESILNCNRIVEEKVKKSLAIYGSAARLLLLLGPVSQFVVENQENIDSITASRNEIPYLLHHVDTKEVRKFVEQLLAASRLTNKMQFRRFFGYN